MDGGVGGSGSGGPAATTGEGSATDQRRTSFLAMTEAGKPVFYATLRCCEEIGARRTSDAVEKEEEGGDEEDVSRLCGLVRAICGSLEYGGLPVAEGQQAEGEAMKSLHSDDKILVFLSVGALTLVAISRAGGPRSGRRPSTVAYLRLQLEYAYGLVLATLTDYIQSRLALDPSYDLRLDLGLASENSIRSLLEESEVEPAPFLTSAVPTFFPLAAAARDTVSRVLKAVGESIPNTLLALVFARSELVTLVQPSYVKVSASDLLLLRHVVTRQHAEADQRLWIPVCLPRIHPSGFLHAYVHPLDGPTHAHRPHCQPGALLVLVSSVGTSEQFNAFRRAEASVRTRLGLSAHLAPSSGVLEILEDAGGSGLSPATGDTGPRSANDDAEDRGGAHGLDVAWRRVEDRRGSDEDYVDASGDGDRIIKYVPEGEAVGCGAAATESDDVSPWSLLSQIESSNREPLMAEYLQSVGALHFMFRLIVPVATADDARHRGQSPHVRSGVSSVLSQCVSSPFRGAISAGEARRNAWLAYQRLSLRLRLGSAAPEATHDALDRIAVQDRASEFCLGMKLAETSPSAERVSYVSEGGLTYLALNGAEFELYMTFPSEVPAKQSAALGGRLARRLLLDQETLFVSKPMVFRDSGT